MEYTLTIDVDADAIQHLEKPKYTLITAKKPGGSYNPVWCAPTPAAPPTWIDFDAGYNLYKGDKTGEGFAPVKVDAAKLEPSPHEALPLTEQDDAGKDQTD